MTKYLSEYIELMKEWDWVKNKNLNPNIIKKGSNKKVWWICNKGHSWPAIIANRTRSSSRKGSNCPYCTNKKVCKDNCLLTIYPHIAKEWNINKNDMTPYDVVAFSGKKVWWICDRGHEWMAPIIERTKYNKGCPCCCNNKVCSTNCLSYTHPDQLNDWDYEKNTINPNQLTYGSNTKVWWKCQNGHSWYASVKGKVINGFGCKYCSGNAVCEDNCLSNTHPKALDLWDYEKNTINPNEITYGTNMKVWWVCQQGHHWQAKPLSIINASYKCKNCYNHTISNISQTWLDELNIPQENREILINIGNKIIKVDAIIDNTIYEFYGCFWHGCPNCYPNGKNCFNKKTFNQLYKDTLEREKIIKNSGYNLISIWEGTFKNRRII